MASPAAVTPVPTLPVRVRIASNWPLSGVLTVSAPGCPLTANGPRLTVKVSCALDNSFDTGFCGLPDKSRGACASSASLIADSAIAAGASTTELPVSGCNGAAWR
ncbi:MAG: hypothetical protein WBE90_01085, partial [Xanthobacteraceae bacterium]